MGCANIKEFLFYNCPECDIRLKDGEKFVQHALNNHELSKFFLNKSIEEILSPNCEETLHQEREENRKECPPPMESPVHFQDDEDLLIPAVKTELDPLTPVEVCRCNICSMPFQTTFELEQHVKQFHQMQKKLHEIQCTYCISHKQKLFWAYESLGGILSFGLISSHKKFHYTLNKS